MRLDDGQIEVVDEAVARVLRQKTGVERLRIAHEMWSLARARLEAYLRFRHPDWDEDRIRKEVARRLAGGRCRRPPIGAPAWAGCPFPVPRFLFQ